MGREVVVVSKDFFFTPDRSWAWYNNYMNNGDHRLMKRGMNKRYRVEMYDVESGFRVVVIDKREKANAVSAIPFDMVTGATHSYSFGRANWLFKMKCKEYGIESCEVTKYFRWYEKYD